MQVELRGTGLAPLSSERTFLLALKRPPRSPRHALSSAEEEAFQGGSETLRTGTSRHQLPDEVAP